MSSHIQALASIIGEDGRKLVQVMKDSWSYPMADYAADSGVPVTRTRKALRFLRQLGLVEIVPWHNEDDCLIRGSGYCLTSKGRAVQDELFLSK